MKQFPFFLIFIFSCNTHFLIEHKPLGGELNKKITINSYGFIYYYSMLSLQSFIKFNSQSDTLFISDCSADVFLKSKDSIFYPVKLILDSNLMKNIIVTPNDSSYYSVEAIFIDSNGYYLFDTSKYEVFIELNYLENGKNIKTETILKPIQPKKYMRIAKRMTKHKSKLQKH